MKNTKLAIDRKLLSVPKKNLIIKVKYLESDVHLINKGLAASVLFKDVEVTKEHRQKLKIALQADKKPDLSKLPFDDFCVLTDLEFENKDGVIGTRPNALINRFTKSKIDSNVVLITTYVLTEVSDSFVMLNIKGVDLTTGNYGLVGIDKRFKNIIVKNNNLKDTDDDFLALELLNSYLSFLAIKSFEAKAVYSPLTFSERKHVPRHMESKYIEYTLDLSKPRKTRLFKKPSKGGSHSSPCEHMRIGHERVYKSGKRVWVKGSVVNKGSVSGKVEKDYSLNQ